MAYPKLRCIVSLPNSFDNGERNIANRSLVVPFVSIEKELTTLLPTLNKYMGRILSVMKPVMVNETTFMFLPQRTVRIYDGRDRPYSWIDMPYRRDLRYQDVLDFLDNFWDHPKRIVNTNLQERLPSNIQHLYLVPHKKYRYVSSTNNTIRLQNKSDYELIVK
jgi:hypothetical protein